jgi:SAM-dependent methyltransferase
MLALPRELRENHPVDVDLRRLSKTLTRDASGLWSVVRADRPVLSFPETSYQANFELEDRSFWFEHRNACIAAAIARFPFTGPLLDVGGGNGAVSVALEQRGISTVVLEPGIDGALNALRRGLRDVICATLDDAAFEAGAFGAAGLFDVIEHVEDDLALLRATGRVLGPGGMLCVTVPALPALWSSEDAQAGHFRRYTLSMLRDVLVRAGFDVCFETYFFAPLVAPMFLLRSLPHRLGRGPKSESRLAAEATRLHEPSPLARRALLALMRPEVSRIGKGRPIPVGTSCLVVARTHLS